MARLVALAAWLLAGTIASADARTLSVEAGSLRASVDVESWRLAFSDETGAPVLTESAAQPLGFATADGWRHATRLASIRTQGTRALTAIAGTDDPLGRTLEIMLAVDAEGVIRVEARLVGARDDVRALGIAFGAGSGERFFGFGERANAVDQRGNVVENYVADGPYQPEERRFVEVLVPPPGFRGRDDATYYPVPWLLSSRGVGVLIDNAETSYFRVATPAAPERWSLEVTGSPEGMAALPVPESLRFRVFAGPRPADVLRRFTARTGRQPPPAAPWVLGPWVQLGGSLADRLGQLAKLRAADAPLSVVQTYTHYLPCGDHVTWREGERALVRALHDAGAAVTTYFNPMICDTYAPRFSEAVQTGALSLDPARQAYVYDYTGSAIFRVGQFDFTTRAGRALYGRLLAEAIEDGHDGWMEDFGEYTPLDAQTAGGLSGSAYHNLYPVQYHCGAYAESKRARRPVVRFQRSGWTGAAPCAQVVWNGDPSTDWGFDGLTSAVWGALGMGFSGIAVWGSDVGGFFALGTRALTAEMLVRWVQFGAVSGVMRTQHNGFALPAKTRPQIYDDDQIGNWKRYAKLRTQLYPYVAAALDTYRRTGLPLMRHLALVHPEDAAGMRRDDQFLFGADLLAAPVLAPGATTRSVHVPPGEWIDLWRAGRWDSAAGAFVLGAAIVVPGAREMTIPAPREELPLLVRAGAVLPLLPPEVDTLADYGDPALGLVSLAARADRAVLLAFPRGSSTATMFSVRETLRSREERAGGWELVVRGRRRRSYELQASLRTLVRPFTPCAVEWAGQPLAAWSYDPPTGVLRTEFTGKRGRLVVRPCAATSARRG
jgi:alpha-glucosidase (family GH31 glycosyl hydrolase)